MRAFCILSLIACLAIAMISTKPLEESSSRKDLKPLNKTEIANMIKELQLLEKLANETYYSPDPKTQETYLTKEPTGEETKEPTGEETKEPTGEEIKEPTGEEVKIPTGEVIKIRTGENGEEEFFIVEEDEDEDDATLDRPTEAIPVNFLKYPEHAPDFKAYPRFAMLRNGYVHHMNLDF
ncbi:uncharacterized protein [Drosophila takahashii]|uniref:uncharacterized protein n=1 Tax=Drosophila takahashii TaxID=29030 RepID=UPI001CF8E1C3|nr:uncharacterized protein LOC108063720 [Drosophila takahashii]